MSFGAFGASRFRLARGRPSPSSPSARAAFVRAAISERGGWPPLPRNWLRRSVSSAVHSRPPGACDLRMIEFHRFLMSLSVRLGM